LHCITTYWDVVKYFLKKAENNLAWLKKFCLPVCLFKRFNLRRERRKRLNTPPGCVAAGQNIV